jgi:VWFA-related protein
MRKFRVLGSFIPLLFTVLAAAQANPPLPSDPIPFVAAQGAARRLKLDVVVADKSDKPVSGLGAQDFTLLDNDRAEPILSFQAVDAGAHAAEPPVAVLLLVDELNIGAQSFATVSNQLVGFLQKNGGHLARPVSLFVLTDQGLTEHGQPSTDGNALAAEVGKLDNKFRTINQSSGEWGINQRLTLSLETLRAIARYERKKPGRKLLIWVGSGWPTWDLRQLPVQPARRQSSFDWIVQLSTLLREARIAVYSVSPGIGRSANFYYENFLTGVKTAKEANIANLGLPVIVHQSGGRVLGPDNDLARQIDRCIQDAAAYYTLTFDPPPAPNANEYRDLTIRIAKPGLAARTSTGFYNQPPPIAASAQAPSGSESEADRALPVATQRVTVEELERRLKDVAGRPDAEVARQLSGLSLTDRLSSAKLAAWTAEMPGAKASQALVALADASAFLDPPPGEIPDHAPPDLPEQRLIMERTLDYLRKTLPKLPDFIATQRTVHYEEPPLKPGKEAAENSVERPLRLVNASSATVFFRDGHEVLDPAKAKAGKASAPVGHLVTRGVFGTILAVAIADGANGHLSWSHWEQGGDGPRAVFRFAVPKEKSHYSVSDDSAFLKNDSDDPGLPTGYRGEIAIDPASGTILRLVIQANPEPGSQIARADIMVEYGPMDIGGKPYYCPVRSVSLSRGTSFLRYDLAAKETAGPELTMLNDVAFGDYHVFRSESRMLVGDDGTGEGK